MKQKIFKTIIGLIVIAIVQVLSTAIVKFLNLTFPPSLLGMILLSFLLYFKIIPMKLVKDACDILLENMVLFFVPVTVGMMLYKDIISKNFLVLGIVIVVSSVITLVVTALIADYFVERKQRKLNK